MTDETNTRQSEGASRRRVSVVVATYNRAPLLPNLLAGLERQTLSRDEFEVVIVDDGSVEPVRPVIENRATPLALRLLEQSNTGQAGARHRGIEEAQGDIIVIVDDDMELSPNLLEAHLKWHEKGYRLVFGRIHPAKKLVDMPLFERFHADHLEKMVIAFRKGDKPRGLQLCTGNVSFRREDYFKVGGFDRALKRSEDRDLGIRLEQAGAPIAYAEDAGTTHESDHNRLEVWLKRAYDYGIYDMRIYKKHPRVHSSNPWRFFFMVNPISRPLLLLITLAPQGCRGLAPNVFRVADWLDQHGPRRLALRATTLVYGLEYFRGMRTESGSFSQSIRDLLSYARPPNRD